MSRERFSQPLFPAWDTLHATRAPEACFEDEIAIDFPSVGDLVMRARDRFLGEDPSDGTLTAEVWLSHREASRGTTIPLDVPLRGTCAGCGGRGETWAEPCHTCRGTGDSLVRRAIRVAVPPGVADGARLRFRVRAPHAEPVRVEVRVGVRSSAA